MAYEVATWSGVLLLGLIVMYFSSKWTTDGAIGISKSIGIKAFAVGFIFISLTTSFPELFITALSSLRGETGLALGNIFGSNLSNITAVLGLVILMGGTIYLTRKELIDLIELMFITTLIPLFLILRSDLTVLHGIILISLYLVYVYKISRSERTVEGPAERDFFKLFKSSVRFLGAVALLLAGSEIIVRSAIVLAGIAGLSTTLVGITIVAIGTSLPELFVGIQSVKRKEYSLALGNIFGSGITNFTLVLGTLALFSDGQVDIGIIGTSIPYLIVATMGIWYIITKKEALKPWVGVSLVLFYTAFVLQEIGVFAILGL